jgi:hypothetical protein
MSFFFDGWYEDVLAAAEISPPRRFSADAHLFGSARSRGAEFTHAELNSSSRRRRIQEENPERNFDYSQMRDDNIDEYSYVGTPMKIFPKYWYHLTRNRSAKQFEKYAEKFVDMFREANPKTPPPLVLQLADRFRKAEYVRLHGEAVLSVQRKYSPFETFIHLEPEIREAHDILRESYPVFKARMRPMFIDFLLTYKSENETEKSSSSSESKSESESKSKSKSKSDEASGKKVEKEKRKENEKKETEKSSESESKSESESDND